MNNIIENSWIDASLYEVNFISDKSKILFSRMCVIPIKKEETELIEWFKINFEDTHDVRITHLGYVWVSRDNLLFF